MASFKDKTGEAWPLALDVSYFARFREAGLDLDAILAGGPAMGELLFGSVRKLGEVAWVMVADAAAERGVTPDQFARRFDGPTAERFGEGLMEAFADFSPRSSWAQAIKGNLRAALAEADAAVLTALNGPHGSWPASSGSTPAG